MGKTRKPKKAGVIMVFAGTNGAGKSSVIGQYLSGEDGTYYNPDEQARRLRRVVPNLSQTDANAQAWARGRDLLVDAIRHGTNFNFETTLGANTIRRLLREAAESGLELHMYYVGLQSPEMHIQRVANRVRKGGHDIPEHKIRERFESSRKNLIDLLPVLYRVVLFDNSAAPDGNGVVEPLRVLRMEAGSIIECLPEDEVPGWAREIVDAARRMDLTSKKSV